MPASLLCLLVVTVALVSLLVFLLSLFIFHYLTHVLYLWSSLTRFFTQLFCLSLVLFVPSVFPASLPSSSVFFFSLPSSSLSLPFLAIFSSSSHSPCESHGRNRAGCQLDERGHAGPADLVMLSHHEASLSLSPCLPFTCTYKVGSNLTLSTCCLLRPASLTSSDSSELSQI